MKNIKVILASKSPRRRELLSIIEPDYVTAPDREVEESYPADMPADEVPAYLSRLKSDAYASDLPDRAVLVTADTVVVLDGRILGKPADEAEAVEMLGALAGRTHHVVTGVTLRARGMEPDTFSVSTEVTFAPLSDDDIRYYVDRYRPLDKAGAYGIQEWIGAAAVEKINGSHYNVVGLPLHRLFHRLRDYRRRMDGLIQD